MMDHIYMVVVYTTALILTCYAINDVIHGGFL